jgi:hypothetical protein
MVAERRRRCPYRSTVGVQRAGARRGGPDVRMPAAPWSPCPRPRSASARPVPGVRCDRPVSARAMSTRPVSNVRVSNVCPGVDVRRSACSGSASAVSAPGDFVARFGGGAATRPGGSHRPAISANGSGSRPSQSRAAEPARAVLGQRRRRAGPGRRRGRRSGSGPGSIAWPARDTPVARQDRPSVKEQRPRAVHPICGMAAQVVRAMLAGISRP